MEIIKIGSRSTLFRYFVKEWSCGMNMHLITATHRNYLIDTGCGSVDAGFVKEYLKGDDKPLIVINTHYHWDHIWGNHCFDDTVIIANKRSIELIKDSWDICLEDNKHLIKGEVRLKMPNLTFDDEIYFEDDKIRIFYTPGHTPDGISIYDDLDKVLNAGDNIGDTMDAILPVIEDMADFKSTIKTYEKLDIDHIASGHNIPLDRSILHMIKEELLKNERI